MFQQPFWARDMSRRRASVQPFWQGEGNEKVEGKDCKHLVGLGIGGEWVQVF